MIFELVALLFGIILLAYCSERGVDHATGLAEALGVPTIVIGAIVVSMGTDLPEIANSVISSAMGHGDINVGDSLGSCLAQISLVMGVIGLVSGGFSVDKEEILELGRAELMGLLLAAFVVRGTQISRLDAALLIAGYVLLVISMRHYLLRNYQRQEPSHQQGISRRLLMLFLFMAGVGLGSYVTIVSVVSLSKQLLVPEYLISFFILAIGTSLPELVVDITAVRKGQYGLAIGDIIGSNVIDSTLSIGVGPLIFPTHLSSGLPFTTAVWTLAVSLAVILTLGLRGKLDRRASFFFIALYALSYLLVLS